MILALIATFFLAAPEIGTEKNGVIHVDAAEAAEVLRHDNGIIVLDVRTRGEYDDGHLDGAVQINYFAPNFKRRLSELDSEAAYLVHCKSGGRSSRAVRLLKDQGTETIYHLDGGILAWKEAGLPIVKEEATP